MKNRFTEIALTAGVLFVLAFTINSCASKAQKPNTSNQEELELREKKNEMMKELDENR